jgi:hypothetical protein
LVATGAAFQMTNVGETEIVTSLGTLKCTTASLSETPTANNTTSGSEGETTSTTFAGTGSPATGEPDNECTSAFGNFSVTYPISSSAPWCLEATEANDNFKVRGGKCTEATKTMKFIYVLTFFGAAIDCNYERATSASGTLRTDQTASEDATVTIAKQVWTGASTNGSGCFSSVELSMTFTLRTSAGEPVYFSS